MVYVLDVDERPLMPTKRHGHVRRLLKEGRAHVIRRCPFTIQLNYETGDMTQDITLGVDAGSKTIGLSATTERDVLFEAELTLRDDIVKLMARKRELRQARRSRKTRHRKPRFDNRKKPEGWLAPSVENKISAHLHAVNNVCKLLPVSKIVVEVAAFDLQRMKADEAGLARPQGKDYQRGEQLGFWNVREYVLFRDGHTCQCCKGKSRDDVLNVHHIESRQTGGNAPDNLITLCRTCHAGYHAGKVKLPKRIHRGMRFRDATFMGVMRWKLYERLRQAYEDVSLTYGYLTKHTRIAHGLQKTHAIDARCISEHPDAATPEEVFLMRKVRCHNRQLHKMTIAKGGRRKRNQAPRYVHSFQLFDKVEFEGVECFVFGRRATGYFDIRTLDGHRISASVSYRKLTLLEKRRRTLVERRSAVPPHV